jgi:septal ring-binding cell division protein DamX
MRNKKSPFIILLAVVVVIICFVILYNDGNGKTSDSESEVVTSDTELVTKEAKSATEDTQLTMEVTEMINTTDAQKADSEEKINNIVENAEKYREANDYDSAIATIESGLVVYPDSQVLLSKKELYILEKEKYESDTKEFETTSETRTIKQEGDSTSRINNPSPFYGIWCEAYKKQSNAEAAIEKYIADGIDAEVFLTTDWSNLNSEKWYVISAGVYSSKEEAKAMLSTIQGIYPNAYVKYSGDWQGKY